MLYEVITLAFAPDGSEASVTLDGTSNILSQPEFEDLEPARVAGQELPENRYDQGQIPVVGGRPHEGERNNFV